MCSMRWRKNAIIELHRKTTNTNGVPKACPVPISTYRQVTYNHSMWKIEEENLKIKQLQS